jgi:Ca-activated chloride channel family protein
MPASAPTQSPVATEDPAGRGLIQFTLTLIAVFCLVAAMAAQAAARPAAPAIEVRPDEVGRGSLLFRGEGENEGSFTLAPELKTVVDIDVTGVIARTTVRQAFTNPGSDWLEGVYVFPLPDRAAVDTLKMRIGDRLIEGRIEERKKAKKIYQQARKEGRKAALLESERPNIFTTSVANIGPGETITVEIRYQERLAYKDGEFRLRFPMVVGPRYIPGNVQVARFGGNGWALPTDKVADADRITPPVRHPDHGPINPLELTVRLQPGFALAGLKSHHHKIVESAEDETANDQRVLTLAAGEVPADRDFELTWRPLAGHEPAAGLFTEKDENGHYALLMLMPPQAEAMSGRRQGRELTFIVDVSGSMAGASIRQAKAALIAALDTLTPQDRFNIIAFNSSFRSLFQDTVPADGQTLPAARQWIDALKAEGGTEMASPIRAALSAPGTAGLIRQIVFLTDGAVGNETELFRIISSHLGKTRLFTVGIGSAPNSHFMRGAARAGRGTFLHIGSPTQVKARIGELVRKLERPALTSINLEIDGGSSAEIAPSPIPDLYAGEPVVLTIRSDRPIAEATVSGKLGRDVWRQIVPLSGGERQKGIAKLWAREKIATLEDRRPMAEDPADLDKEILTLALDNDLVTRLTSLVAVDVTPSRPADRPLRSESLETNLPHGWEFEKVFGDSLIKAKQRRASLAPATPAASGKMTPQLAAAKPQPMQLPRTATPAQLHLLLGLALLLVALALWWRARRRNLGDVA